MYIKFNKRYHQIDSKINNEEVNINSKYISNVIEDYDQILKSMEYSFPIRIKNKIKKQYENKLSLPSTLSVDIVECKVNVVLKFNDIHHKYCNDPYVYTYLLKNR